MNLVYISIDFDGVCCEKCPYPEIGQAMPNVKESLHQLLLSGKKIIINTCRSGAALESAIQWLKDNGIPYTWINENPDRPTNKKVYADLYVDDRGYRFRDWPSFFRDLKTLEMTSPPHEYIITNPL